MSDQGTTGSHDRHLAPMGSPTMMAIRHLRRRKIAVVCFGVLCLYFGLAAVSYLRGPGDSRFIGEWFEDMATQRLVGPDGVSLEYVPPTLGRPDLSRLEHFDYTQPGAYFVTIYTHKKRPLLGFIKNGEVFLREWGRIVKRIWEGIPHHQTQVNLDTFTIMPNHVHEILWLTDHEKISEQKSNGAEFGRFGNIAPKSLPSVIRSFKSEVTREINISRNIKGERFWQRNYYEHIIRHEDELFKIRK